MGRTETKLTAGWVVCGAIWLAWAVFAFGANQAKDSNYRDKLDAAKTQQVFWRVVAGREQGNESGVLNKLANDLRATPASELVDFRGDSNRYGGITEALGYDPFNGPNCQECGPLDDAVVADAIEIKKGGLQAVVARLQPPKPDHVSGPPLVLWLVWLVSLPLAVFGYKRYAQHRHEVKYGEYTQELELADSLSSAMKGLPSPQADELGVLRSKLLEGIDQRVKYGEDEAKQMRLAALKEEALATLEAIDEGNRVLAKGEHQ
jgi:hypothetical protein